MGSDLPTASPTRGDTVLHDAVGGKEKKTARLGRYLVVEYLSTGGMGTVYRAIDTQTQRPVAIKVMPPKIAEKHGMLERFKREADSCRKLDHPNVVTVLDFGEYANMWYLAMEFVDGIDLYDHVKKVGRIDPEDARQWIVQGARALRHAHEQGIIHRDVKPSNFMLQQLNGRPHVKLTDFGLAREIDDAQFRLTRAGTTVGTIDYMSPEQARDSGLADTRSDLYSLGCTWYFLLTGQAPFPHGGLGERLNNIMYEPPTDVREHVATVSDDCAKVLHRLLLKDPGARFQGADELISALLALEGHTTTRRSSFAKPQAKKSVARPVGAAPAVGGVEKAPSHAWTKLAVVACLLMLGVAVVALSMPRRPTEPTVNQPSPIDVTPSPHPVAKVDRTLRTFPPIPIHVEPHPAPPPTVPELRLLPGNRDVDVAALRQEILAPWANAPAVAASARTVHVSRAATHFRTLADACKAGEPGTPLVIEIHDNGPLFALPVEAVEGRDVVVRAAKGYRPLLLWDVPATLARPGRKAEEPLTFLRLRKGRLILEGLEIALRWPETHAPPATLLAIEDGELAMTDCTLSVAGKPHQGLTVVRFASTIPGARLRWTRCQVRGAGLTAIDLDAPAAEVLCEGCLVVGGQHPLLRVTSGQQAPKVRIVRSTLVGGSTLLELKPAANEPSPALSWLGWDSLFAQPSPSVAGKVETQGVSWRGVNCLYAGWQNPEEAGVRVGRWPDQVYNEPAVLPASAYHPVGPVLYGATVDRTKPLGCDPAALPPARDTWVVQALEPLLFAPDLPTDDSPPEIPTSSDGKYHGGRMDLAMQDLGATLAKLQEARQLGPRVVLHLTGKGEHVTSPIHLKGTSLVLHFEEPAEKDKPKLTLTLGKTRHAVPLIDLDGGSLDVIGGVLHVPDQSNFHASHVVRVKGGDVRMYRTRVDGPQQSQPEGYVAAVAVAGSGDPAPDKGRTCALNECVVLSSKAAIVLDGMGCRLAMRQCVVVAETEALHLLPGRECTGKTGMLAQLTNVTFAARRAVVRLGDAPKAGVPSDPVVVQARECAYLNPFPGRVSRPGMVVWEGEALPRGLLLWHGEREGFDPRFHFAALSATAPVPETKEGYTPWKQVWGSPGVREPRELGLLQIFEPRRWQLDRLGIKRRDPPGANLDRLEILPRKSGPR